MVIVWWEVVVGMGLRGVVVVVVVGEVGEDGRIPGYGSGELGRR